MLALANQGLTGRNLPDYRRNTNLRKEGKSLQGITGSQAENFSGLELSPGPASPLDGGRVTFEVAFQLLTLARKGWSGRSGRSGGLGEFRRELEGLRSVDGSQLGML